MQHLQDLCSLYYLDRNTCHCSHISLFTNSHPNFLRSLSYLFTEVRPFEGDHADIDGVGDKGLVVHELVGGEGGDRVEEELRSLFEVPDGHTVQALVDLQTIPPVPVSPLLNEAVETDALADEC